MFECRSNTFEFGQLIFEVLFADRMRLFQALEIARVAQLVVFESFFVFQFELLILVVQRRDLDVMVTIGFADLGTSGSIELEDRHRGSLRFLEAHGWSFAASQSVVRDQERVRSSAAVPWRFRSNRAAASLEHGITPEKTKPACRSKFHPDNPYVFLLLEFPTKLLHQMPFVDLHLLDLVLRVMMLLGGDGQVGLQQRILGRDGVECEFSIVDGGLQFLHLLRQ